MSSDIPICTSVEQVSEAFEKADADSVPHLYIRKRRKYARVEVDMITTDYNLSEKAVKRAADLLEKHAQRAYDNPEHKQTPVSIGYSQSIVEVGPLLNPVAVEVAKELRELSFNEENWTA